MIIVGLDVCKLSVVACKLTEQPSEPGQFYNTKFSTFPATPAGIRGLLAMKPDIAILEPTGVNYSMLWGTYLARSGIEVRLVGHEKLRNYRKNVLLLPDKDDEADAYALACYGWEYLYQPKRFVSVRTPEIARIRQLTLRLAHLARCQSPVINRLRQDLAWQFPEIAERKIQRTSKIVPLMLRWLAGIAKSKRYDEDYSKSCGLGLTETVKDHALRLVHIHEEEIRIETELESLQQPVEFEPYHRVFSRFAFGQRLQGILLSQIFPIESYLKDGKPEVIIRKGRRSGKPTKRHLSQRRFQKALGVAPTEESSGDKKGKSIVGGSDLCRLSLWQWVFTRIEVIKARAGNQILEELGRIYDEEKWRGIPIKLVRMKVAAKAARMLFKELVKEIRAINPQEEE